MDIQLTDQIKAVSVKEFGIRPRHIAEAVQTPDQTRTAVLGVGLTINFYMKRIEATKPSHYLLIHGREIDGAIVVDAAFRCYPDLHPNIDSLTPTELLFALVDRFGVDVTVGATTKKIILDESIEASPGQDIPLITATAGTSWHGSMYFKRSDRNGKPHIDCALVYAIDAKKYTHYIESHR